MTNLSSIPGIGKAALELLEAAGFVDAESLAKAGVDQLAKELDRANKVLQIAKRAPARGNVEKWIASARELTGVVVEDAPVTLAVNHEISPRMLAMLSTAPLAIPLPGRLLVERQLAVADIPPAILLNRHSGDLDIKVEERVPAPKHGRPSAPSNNVRLAETSGTRMEIDSSRIKSTDSLAGGTVRTFTSKNPDNERVALIRGPRVETNQGLDPSSRRYVRGVLHSHPFSIGIGALATLILVTWLPTGIVSAGLLLLSAQVPAYFSWVPKWLLVFPLGLPVFGLAYLIWGVHGGCRICGQRMFVPRMCLKNTKAHHIRGLGHIVPVSLHILLFKWFRCTYCGTPVRLKK